MITGVHAVIFTTDAEQDRAFFRDVLELPFADAGEGWQCDAAALDSWSRGPRARQCMGRDEPRHR
jgi:catechol 2,3-dioxygenase-like lactoylglutathione lyase family enzyme